MFNHAQFQAFQNQIKVFHDALGNRKSVTIEAFALQKLVNIFIKKNIVNREN